MLISICIFPHIPIEAPPDPFGSSPCFWRQGCESPQIGLFPLDWGDRSFYVSSSLWYLHTVFVSLVIISALCRFFWPPPHHLIIFIIDHPLLCDAGLCLMPQEWTNKYFGMGKEMMGRGEKYIAGAGRLHDVIFWQLKGRTVFVRIRDVIALGVQQEK